MKITRVLSGLSVLTLFTACANQRSEPVAATPAASPSSAVVTSAPAREREPSAPFAAAPAPQGLDQPEPSASAQEEDFTTVEAAERALNQAKSDLDRWALAAPERTLARGAADRSSKKDAKAASGASAAEAAAAPSAQCDNACRAFSSLTRAANAVCRLDGESGTHCTRAKHVVLESERRVSSCACPAAGQ